jgi:hypothetical protein
MIMKQNRPVLEYRLWKGNETYTPLYFYEHIELEQILARRECEFFIKEGVTYKQVSSAKEDHLFVIYVEKYEENPPEPEDPASRGSLKLEIRELNSIKGHPLIESVYLDDHLDVLSYIGSSFTYFLNKEWERDSAELDEDRKVYVLYVTATGYEWESEED